MSDDYHLVLVIHLCGMAGLQHKCRKHLDHTNETSPSFSKTRKRLSPSDLQECCSVCWLCPEGSAAKQPWCKWRCTPGEPASETQETALSSKDITNGSHIFILPSCLLLIYSGSHQNLKSNPQDFTAAPPEVTKNTNKI